MRQFQSVTIVISTTTDIMKSVLLIIGTSNGKLVTINKSFIIIYF